MNRITPNRRHLFMPRSYRARPVSSFIYASDENVFTLNVETGEYKSFRDAGMASVYARRINRNYAIPRVVICIQTKDAFHMI